MKVILCNCPAAEAKTIAAALVTRRLAACVNILPTVQSLYIWEGALHDEPEIPLLIKTSDEAAPALVEALTALHPYEVPEIIALDVAALGSAAPYIDWVNAAVAHGPTEGTPASSSVKN
ncbi:divalent-cation tolerance protein CutA [Myxococcota bacterium]|nr:divalent-cation tolerance protein CutA [Myxococcota bacterium]MBU1430076.1 divalent-cation tolerance protein CutA [Myxococcota bacterium]MBU1900126.1 divalent-cation tolerance protein CutA [Myxococcota bacterium]